MPTVQIYQDYEAMSDAAAQFIIDVLEQKPTALLCFATGNTPVGTYQFLAEKVKARGLDLSRCFCIGLDEWLDVPSHKRGTCKEILYKQVFIPLGIQETQIHLFDGEAKDPIDECKKMDQLIEAKGGIDWMLVGVGLNGHIGFNEPGVDIDWGSHIQELHPSTLNAGQHYFDEPTAIKKGITLGMSQVLLTKKLLMIADGAKKATIMQAVLNGPVHANVPASYIQEHLHAVVMMDQAAAALLNN